MSKSIDFYFDVGSPASYLAWTQLPALVERCGAEIIWKPMLLGGVFKATGNQAPIMTPAKGRYVAIDLMRYAKKYDVPFDLNPFFPVNTLQMMRAAVGYLDTPQFHPYLTAIFTALWVDKKNMGDPQEVAAVLTQAGFDPTEVLTISSDPDVKEKLKVITEEAVSRGAFGAPTFFIDDEIFFGQDRLAWIETMLSDK